MPRRKLLIVLAMAVLAAVLFGPWPQSRPVSRITRENYERIRLGMSLAEVQEMLGPPGDNRTGDTKPDPAPPGGLPLDAPPTAPGGHRGALPWDG